MAVYKVKEITMKISRFQVTTAIHQYVLELFNDHNMGDVELLKSQGDPVFIHVKPNGKFRLANQDGLLKADGKIVETRKVLDKNVIMKDLESAYGDLGIAKGLLDKLSNGNIATAQNQEVLDTIFDLIGTGRVSSHQALEVLRPFTTYNGGITQPK